MVKNQKVYGKMIFKIIKKKKINIKIEINIQVNMMLIIIKEMEKE